VKQCPKLYKLKLENNDITSIDKLKCLTELGELKKINVTGNPFVDTNPKYSKELFNMIKTLESVDSHDKEGKDVESSVYEEGEEEEDDEEFDEDDEEFDDEDEGEEYNDDDEDEDDGDDDDDDEDDEEEEKPKKRQKK
jgi:hypothetical protein